MTQSSAAKKVAIQLAENVVELFPKLKKAPNGEVDLENVSEEELQELSFHYLKQLIYQFESLGFNVRDPSFVKDLDIVYQAIYSSLLRNAGKYHPFQDDVDLLYESVAAVEEE